MPKRRRCSRYLPTRSGLRPGCGPRSSASVSFVRVPLATSDGFRRLVTRAFTHRRKRLGNALRGMLDEVSIRSCGVDPDRRPGTLTFEEFAELARKAVTSDRRADAGIGAWHPTTAGAAQPDEAGPTRAGTDSPLPR